MLKRNKLVKLLIGVVLVLLGCFIVVPKLLLFILPIQTTFDWIDALWLYVGSVCLYFGVRRLSGCTQ